MTFSPSRWRLWLWIAVGIGGLGLFAAGVRGSWLSGSYLPDPMRDAGIGWGLTVGALIGGVVTRLAQAVNTSRRNTAPLANAGVPIAVPVSASPALPGAVSSPFQLSQLLATLFAAPFDNADYMFFKDRQYRYQGATQSLARLAGRDSWQQLIGQTDFDLYDAGLAARHRAEDRQVMDTGESLIDIAGCYQHPDFGERWLASCKFPLRDEKGEIIGVFGYVRDITDQRCAEQALAERESELVTLMETMPGIVYRAFMDDHWTMQFVSDHVGRMTGYSAEQLIGNRALSFASLIHPDDRARVAREVRQAVAAGCPFNVDYRLICRDGRELWVLEQGRALDLVPTPGEAVSLVGTILDINERKNASENLRRLLDAAPDAMIVADPEGLIALANQQTELMFGYRRDELEGLPATVLMPVRLRDRYAVTLQKLSDRLGKELPSPAIRTLGLTRAGKEVPLEATFSTIEMDGRNMLACNLRDITMQKQVESQLQRARDLAEEASLAKTEFLANISHEIRTPLHAILGMHHLLARTGLDSQQQSYVENAEQSAQALLATVNDVLDFSRAEAGCVELEAASFSLDDLLARLTAVSGYHAQAKGLRFLIDIGRQVPQQLVGDSLRLGQVLTNLVSNAVKFTEQGAIVIRVNVAERRDRHVELVFTVTDTGIGIDTRQQQRIFQPFIQADTSTTRRYGGTGLGLSICQRLVGLMGGELRIHSTPGVGSCFEFNARLEVGDAEPQAQARLERVLAGRRVLLVESETDSGLGNLLGRLHLTVDCESSAASALARLQPPEAAGGWFDLVVINLPMDATAEAMRWLNGLKLPRQPRILALVDDMAQGALPETAGVRPLLLRRPLAPSVLLDALMDLWEAGLTDEESSMDLDAMLPQLAGRRVLVAEDNALSRRLAVELLCRLGLVVVAVETGREALAKALAEPFDLVLMDVQMPEMDGLEVTAGIRRHRHLDDLPIIAMTASTLQHDLDACLEAGMNGYLSKPIGVPLLHRTLLHWLRNHSGEPLADEA